MILAWLACGPAPVEQPVGEVLGRTYMAPQLGAAIEFGEGWQLAMEPEHFRAELGNTLLEARHGELVAVLTFHALPDVGLLESAGAVDLLPVLHPVPDRDDSYRFERLPDCDGSVLRRSGDWIHIAQRTPTGLIEWQAFGGDIEPLIELVCHDTKVE